MGSNAILSDGEPTAFLSVNRRGKSDFVITVDHASRVIPKSLGSLGLSDADLTRHIAWDIGALAVAQRVATLHDAALVAQNYSRLVIDCNRPPETEGSIPTIGEDIQIPGNFGLAEQQKIARRRAIFDPYHRHIGELLDERRATGRPTILVAQHSMTDQFMGQRRPMHAAVMYNRDPAFSRLMLAELRREPGLIIGDNEPYYVSDEGDYSIPVHGERRGLPHVAIEIRQDLIFDERGQAEWATRISNALFAAAAIYRGNGIDSSPQ